MRSTLKCCRQPSAAHLTDIVADSGRPVKLRFDRSIRPGWQAREQELPDTIDIKQALAKLDAARAAEASGELCANRLAAIVQSSWLMPNGIMT